jgi:preprotein translocase subunit SecA
MARIPHEVLNAKNHAREAEIVMLAGQPGAVTIATNMAGRGTDIKLGKGVVTIPPEVIKSQTRLEDKVDGPKTILELLEERPQGLHVIGSERHESRRIDRQLRGRCSRQGDPGSSQFYISLEDPLMRLFGSQRIAGIMESLGMKEGEVMEHRWLNKSVETAQRRVEQQHYAVRKRTLEYDDVMNKQRGVVYGLRMQVLQGDQETVHNLILDVFNDVLITQCEAFLSDKKMSDAEAFLGWLTSVFPVAVSKSEIEPFFGEPEKACEFIFERIRQAYEDKCAGEDPQVLPYMERGVFLNCIDRQWQEYLRAMDDLRQNVNLRSYGQRDPLIEYKREAFGMFENFMNTIKSEIANNEFRATTAVNVRSVLNERDTSGVTLSGPGDEPTAEEVMQQARARAEMMGRAQRMAQARAMLSARPQQMPQKEEEPLGPIFVEFDDEEEEEEVLVRNETPASRPIPPLMGGSSRWVNVGRNDPCPCGSGKKFKKCHGASQV